MFGVVRHWHRLHREVVDAPSLETLRSGWRGSEHLMELLCPHTLQGSWIRRPLMVPSNPKDSMILKIPFRSIKLHTNCCALSCKLSCTLSDWLKYFSVLYSGVRKLLV